MIVAIPARCRSSSLGSAVQIRKAETSFAIWSIVGLGAPSPYVTCPSVVSGGVMEVAPGVVSGWMVGTVDGWCANWRSITKGTRRFHDSLFKAGVRRIELVALQSRKDACHWYEKGLKMHREGVRRMYGKNGENAVAYARVNHERR